MKKIIGFGVLGLVFGMFGFVTLAADSSNDDNFDSELESILAEIDAEVDNLETTEATYTADENELENAITLLHTYGVTKFDTPETFMATQPIRRDEAGAMYVRLMDTLTLSALEHDNVCTFTDITDAHSDLYTVVEKSCTQGLFKGSKGKFMPKNSITNAQAITVIARMLDGYKNEDGAHFAEEYIKRADAENLLVGLDLTSKTEWDKQATRGTVAILLARADLYVQNN